MVSHRCAASAEIGQVQQNRAGLEQADRLTAWTVGIDDGGNLAVGIERRELRRVAFALHDVDQMRFVRQTGFFEHDRNLDAVGRVQRIKLDTFRMLRRPARGNGEIGQRRHIGAPAQTVCCTVGVSGGSFNSGQIDGFFRDFHRFLNGCHFMSGAALICSRTHRQGRTRRRTAF
jgi:hypothetical protein